MSNDDKFIHLDHLAQGKNLRLHVPNYLYGAPGSPRFDSYLRLGASRQTQEPGDKLGKVFPPGLVDAGASPAGYVDDDGDMRVRDAIANEFTNDEPADRYNETTKLHQGAGWRDHTDGNRVSTTMGDKLEVIGGNYRLIVLGRQFRHGDSPTDEDLLGYADNAAGIDMSGGIIRMPQRTPGSTWREEWKAEDFGGTWQVFTKTQKGHLVDMFHGRKEDYTYADELTSVTGWGPGAPEPPHGDDMAPDEKLCPKVKSYSWLISSEEVTNIAAGTVSTTEIGAGTVSNTMIGGGTVSNTTIGLGTYEETQVGLGTVSHTVIGGGTVSHTTVGLGTMSSTEVGGGTLDNTVVAGLQTSISTVGAKLAIDTVGSALAVNLANSVTSVDLALMKVNIGAVAVEVGVSAGIKLGVHFGVDESVTLPKVTKTKLEEMETIAASYTVCVGGSITMTAASAVNITAGSFKVAGPSIMLG
ncbi:MAG: hypothetical protein R3B72_32535 [Polyangiaceae bacterium]